MYDSYLRSWRKRHGWSRASLAQALGSTVDLITEWEEGISLPSSAMQAAIDQFLGRTDQSLEPVVEAPIEEVVVTRWQQKSGSRKSPRRADQRLQVLIALGYRMGKEPDRGRIAGDPPEMLDDRRPSFAHHVGEFGVAVEAVHVTADLVAGGDIP